MSEREALNDLRDRLRSAGVWRQEDGKINLAIAVEHGAVLLDFGHSVQWMRLTPDQADQVAICMLQVAKAARKVGAGDE